MCDGCKGAEGGPACAYICPHDLMKLDAARMKAYNQEPEQCWDCLCCVKACPRQAIEARPGADYVPMGGTAIPLRIDNSITWTIKFRDGEVKRFTFPTRTTPVGSIDPYGNKPQAGDIKDQRFFTEGGKTLPTI